MFRTQGVITTKAALALQGLPAGPLRLPLVELSPGRPRSSRRTSRRAASRCDDGRHTTSQLNSPYPYEVTRATCLSGTWRVW